MMRKNNNRNNNMKHRSGGGGGGQRRYSNNNNGGGGNRGGQNDGQNLQRTKHHATQQLGKYSDMARNAQINGDRVDVEYYLQHVDHYTRVLSEVAAIEAERFDRQREQQQASQPAEPQQQSLGDENAATQQNASGNENAATATDGNAEAPQQQQPRQQRQPRRQYQPSDNGAKEANSNTTEIPLPDNIIPPI